MTTIVALRQKHEPALLSIAETGFEASLVRAAFDNLEVSGPLCFNNFGYALRELLRHVFHPLAPDDQIKQCPWFKPDPTSQSTITRAHRSKYMLQGGLSDYFVDKILDVEVPPVITAVSAAFETLNKFTHINPETFNLKEVDAALRATECLDATSSLIDNIGTCRSAVLQNLATAIDQHLLQESISDVVNELDEIATHYLIDQIYTESSEVVDIGPKDLCIQVEGNIGVELQYGSSSDVRNDIGTVIPETFPFSATVKVAFTRPLGKKAKISNFKVDTSSWYDE